MNDSRDNRDDDTIIIKPLMFTGTILLSAGAGLAAGLLICWLFCGFENDEGKGQDRRAAERGLQTTPELQAVERQRRG